MDKFLTKETGLVALSSLIARSAFSVSNPLQAGVLSVLSWFVLLYRYERKVFREVLNFDSDRWIWNAITGYEKEKSRSITQSKINDEFSSILNARTWGSSSIINSLSEISVIFEHIWGRLYSLGYKYLSVNELQFLLYELQETIQEYATIYNILLMGAISGYVILSSLYVPLPFACLLFYNVYLFRNEPSEIQKTSWSNFWLLAAFLIDFDAALKAQNIAQTRMLVTVRSLLTIWLASPVPEIVDNKVQYKEENGVTVAVTRLASNTSRYLLGEKQTRIKQNLQ